MKYPQYLGDVKHWDMETNPVLLAYCDGPCMIQEIGKLLVA